MAEVAIEIVRGGDIVLVLTSKDTITKLIVNSNVLRNSSKMFSAMLSPNFAEGKTVQNGSDTNEVTLHGDDPQALSLVMTVIHSQDEVVVQSLARPNSIIDMAVVIDKYLLHGALQHALSRWLTKEDDYTKLRVALVLKDSELLRETIKAMILYQAVSYSREYYSSEDEMLAHCLINVDKARNLIRSSIAAGAHAVALQLDTNPNPCPRAYYHAGLILRRLYALDANKNQTLEAMFNKTLQTLTEEMQPPHDYLCFNMSKDCLMTQMAERCKIYVEKMKESHLALCLHCEILKFEREIDDCGESHDF